MNKNTSVSASLSQGEVQELLNGAQPGDRFIFEPGTYRMSLVVNARGTADSPIILEANEPGTVTLTGADRIQGWQPEGENWVKEIDLTHLPASADHGILDGRREQIFIDGQPLRQVLHKDQLKGGCFCYDEAAGKLLMRPHVFAGEIRGGSLDVDKGAIQGGGTASVDREDPMHNWQFLLEAFNPEDHVVEVTTRSRIFSLAGDYRDPDEGSAHIVVRGFNFRASGDAPQKAMVHIGGRYQTVEDCRFEYGAARGFDMRCHDSVVRKSVSRLNGQLGFSGYGADNLVEDCLLQHNNTKHSTFVCFEQGGCKIVRARNFNMRRVKAVGNDGPGIWYDIDNEDILIEQCWCEGNTGPGIMYEISNTAVIRNNVCWRNGFMPRKDVTWNARFNSVGIEEPVYGQGILVQMSRNCQVVNNTCVGNQRVGIEIRHHPYQQAGNHRHATERYKAERNRAYNNLLADNGWCNFYETTPPLNPVKQDEVADNHYDYNLYHSSAALLQHEGDLLAYARWGKTLGYGVMSLEEWRASRGQDARSIQWDPCFVSPDSGDFDLEPWSPAHGRGVPVEGLEYDFLGRKRGRAPSIGAFESVPSKQAGLGNSPVNT